MKRGNWLRQGGFLYLTTGANGSGKTLFTLRDVRELQLQTSRPVFYCGFTAKQPLQDFGWKECDPTKWQDLPDGSIVLLDEAQNYMPLRGQGPPPDWIGAIAEKHRKRGFDFFMITQHPMNIDAFVRRLIGSPGWHRHMKASFLGDSSNEIKWTAVNPQCERPNSGNTADVVSRPFDKEVYSWYESASMHTARKGIPRKVWLAIAALPVAVAMIAYVVYGLVKQAKGDAPATAPTAAASAPAAGAAPAPRNVAKDKQAALTTEEYLAARQPRIQGFQHTAPAFDAITAPVEAPYPAACIDGTRPGTKTRSCECYTQQGTRLSVPLATCESIVRNGFFIEWRQEQTRAVSPMAPLAAQPVQPQPAGPVVVGGQPAVGRT